MLRLPASQCCSAHVRRSCPVAWKLHSDGAATRTAGLSRPSRHQQPTAVAALPNDSKVDHTTDASRTQPTSVGTTNEVDTATGSVSDSSSSSSGRLGLLAALVAVAGIVLYSSGGLSGLRDQVKVRGASSTFCSFQHVQKQHPCASKRST